MRKAVKVLIPFLLLTVSFLASGLAQDNAKKTEVSKRERARHAMHSRDSLVKSFSKGDTSVNGLLQRVAQYSTSFNQIKNNLAQGLDTSDIGVRLPPVITRIDKITTFGNTHKSSTLRYLFVLRDNLDHIQSELEGWQGDLNEISTKLVQNQTDLGKFIKDTSLLKTNPYDSVVKVRFFAQLKIARRQWHMVDSTNRTALLRVNLLQDKIAIAYTNTLDESDHIDAKIKGFALKAFSGESDYIWNNDRQYNDFKTALSSTIRLNTILFNYFIKSETPTHLVALLFLLFIFSWVNYTRFKVKKNNGEDMDSVFAQAAYICKKPLTASLLVVTAIVPYFYDHPPVVFLETFFLISMVLSLILIRSWASKPDFEFLLMLFGISIIYCVSNLFIALSDVDRYTNLGLSLLSIIMGMGFYSRIKKNPETTIKHASLAIKIFIALHVISALLNITGRFSLAKIIGITADLNLWMLLILYIVVDIIIQALYLQFQVKKGGNSFINWIDYTIVEKKFRTTLGIIASLLWLFYLMQNLNIDDWAIDNATEILNQSQSIAGASFTFGGFVIFIFVIWLSSIVSKIISYFYDVSAQRVSDLSVAKKKNRTSTLLIKMAVFSIGFLLAVAASGFPLEKLTIIISAFGVGIGFGLQNIVNNLVSGLILAFEKPINIGDVIEVDGASGTMQEIGIRSSRILTGDGSEVIIPNGDLISHHVTNWTLNNTNRQLSIIVQTAYGVDIDKIREMLVDLLTKRDDIMDSPTPLVFINNVTHDFVEFKSLFWAADINTSGTLKSKVLSAIYKAFNEQGIEMPSAQTEFTLHLADAQALAKSKNRAKADDSPMALNDTKETPPDSAH